MMRAVFCQCGCGGETPVAKYDAPKRNIRKGEHAKYIHGHNRRRGAAEKFFEKVTKTGSCWLWTGYKDKKGYGQVKGVPGYQSAHRLSWYLHHGDIPNGLFVLHKCDNPECCNPEHLFLGTNQDNVDDMVAKGRAAVGTQNGQSKLTGDAVKAIRAESGTTPQSVLAERFGVDQGTVSRIANRKAWRHL